MRLLLSAGEASGDAYAAAIVREVRRIATEPLEISAMGGPSLLAENVRLVVDSRDWGAIGALESAKVLLKVFRSFQTIKSEICTGTPGWFVPIDFGFANVRLARIAKKAGWNVLYFIPPGSYRRGPQGKDLPGITDVVVTPFPWSEAILKSAGVNAKFLGHPLKQLVGSTKSEAERTGLALLPGSRGHELKAHLPVLASVLSMTGHTKPATFALATGTDAAAFRLRWREISGRTQDEFVVGDAIRVLRDAEFALVCSGTATLQAALCKTPHVIFYRPPAALDWQMRITRRPWPKFIGLPNIILDEPAVPEVILMTAETKPLVDAFQALPADAERQRKSFHRLDEILGPADAITQTARLLTEARAL